MKSDKCISIPWTSRNDFYQWCDDYKILINYEGSFGHDDLWYIDDEKYRMLAILKWT